MDLTVEFENLQYDEYLLVRDKQTDDLVYAHPANEAAPRVKWVQAPFTTIEYEFFKLLKKNYEDKRVLVC